MQRLIAPLAITLTALPAVAGAAMLNLAQYPLFLAGNVPANIMILYDNSQSMDGTMAGKLISGDDLTTRGNIARGVIRETITAYRTQFRWGLSAFRHSGDNYGPTNTPNGNRYNIYPYFFGSTGTMVFTNDCVGGVSPSNGNLRCIANPQPANGFAFITYERSGDDPDVNDVLYAGGWPYLWGVGVANSTSYTVYTTRTGTSATAWGAANFTGSGGNAGFTPTDAGFLPSTPPYDRMMWLFRGWGYYGDTAGGAGVWEENKNDSTAHYNRLMALLARETGTASSGEIKNSSTFTPLKGSLADLKRYFEGSYGNSLNSPIQLSCQKNFVLLATDGNPTARENGQMYTLAQQANTYDAGTNTWTFGLAPTEVFTQIQNLRNITFGGNPYDIETYIVGLGDSVANASSVASLNKMAQTGGTGSAYLAQDANALREAFRRIAVDIVAKTAASSAVSLNSGSWSTGSRLYQARFNSGAWSGQMLAFPVGSNGQLGAQVWDSGQVVNGQNWTAGRNILTYKGSAAIGARGVPFRWPANPGSPGSTEIDLAQVTALNTNTSNVNDGFGSQRLEYLRGNRVNEDVNCPGCTPSFRSRPTSVLGDIINSAPYYVARPAFGYPDSLESAPYSTFVNTWRNRAPMIYVGANDGMLHAFKATDGSEAFAYVPRAVMARLPAYTAISYQHQYTVDGSPTVGDVFYGGQWRTLLVGGLRAGGQALYALDVTDPTKFTENFAANVVRWEFSDADDADLGNTFSQPLLVKTNNGRWSVIVGNGYNSRTADGNQSTTGEAVLFVLDAETGAVTRKITTKAGSTVDPNGLSGPIAIDTNGDGVADVVYAGDLAGNMWRFNINDADPANWRVAYGTIPAPVPLFAAGQPITSRPEVTRFPSGGYLVAFGTGQYIDVGDNSTNAQQTFYGIRDNGAAVVGLTNLVQQTILGTATAADSTVYRITTHAVGPASLDSAQSGDNAVSQATYESSRSGWYMRLTDSGERTVADPAIRSGRVIFTSLVPSVDPCSYGGTGWVMEVDVVTGNRMDTISFDTNKDLSLTNSDMLNFNGTANTSGARIGSIPAAPGFLRLPTPSNGKAYENKYMNTSSGSVSIVGESAGMGASRRVSWEQLR